ncbi:hypothetical protein EYF80_045129 [Liparis tanakae]|uniref:Uncharacterized protein n=1 Tax=Liparis tanakae TaxID=230148 RepID=A0A4Z2FV21_9TELE|nr:hypothetical protein EYF80_045129 [Liparis tanakae]
MSLDSALSLALRSSASLRRHSFSSICRAITHRHKYTKSPSKPGSFCCSLDTSLAIMTTRLTRMCSNFLSWRPRDGGPFSTSTATSSWLSSSSSSSSSESDSTVTFTRYTGNPPESFDPSHILQEADLCNKRVH